MAEVKKTGDNAVLLLAAAHKLDLGPGAVRSTSRGYVAPDEVLVEAGFDPETGEPKPTPKPTQKTTAKKTAAKKSTAK
jgi:hypothetical protein